MPIDTQRPPPAARTAAGAPSRREAVPREAFEDALRQARREPEDPPGALPFFTPPGAPPSSATPPAEAAAGATAAVRCAEVAALAARAPLPAAEAGSAPWQVQLGEAGLPLAGFSATRTEGGVLQLELLRGSATALRSPALERLRQRLGPRVRVADPSRPGEPEA